MAYNSKFTGAQIDALLDASEAMQTSKEDVANKVTTLDADATDVQYPSAKAVKDKLTELGSKTDMLHQEISMGLVIEDIFPSIASTFTNQRYPVYSNGTINSSGSTNTIGYYVLSGDLLRECISVKAFLQCDGSLPAAIAFYSSVDAYNVSTYLGGVQHMKTTGEWFEAEIPSEAEACLITNRKASTSDADPVVLALKQRGLVERVTNIEDEIVGPLSYQEEHLGDIVLASTVTTGSLKVDCNYGDIIKIVADANVINYHLGTANYKQDILQLVKGNPTLYLIMRRKVKNIHVYTPVNSSLQRTISIYKCSKKELYRYPNLVGSFFRYYTPVISNDKWLIKKSFGGTGIITNNKRATTGLLNLKNPSIKVTLSDVENFRFYILSTFYDIVTDHGWQTSYETTIECDSFAITLEKINGGDITADDLNVISVEFTEPIVENYAGDREVERLNSKLKLLEEQKNEFNLISSVNNGLNVAKPYYYHFSPDSFLKDGNGNNAIPSQTSFDIEVAARLGFTFIEANVQSTSDGNFICMHGNGGNFGATVYSLDNSDISNVAINTKTLDWIKENVRFNSYYDKYKVAPLSLEKFCKSCKINGIGIFAGTNDLSAINICMKILGTDNVMLYGASSDKRQYFKGMMFVWSDSGTAASIINTARQYGMPFMYGMGPTLLSTLVTNGELDGLCTQMHNEGFTLASTAVYDTEINTQNAFEVGVDFSASGHQVNPFDSADNIYDINDSLAFSGTGNIKNGITLLEGGETIICGDDNSIPLGKGMLTIRFNGSLTVNFGSKGSRALTSDGDKDIIISDYFFMRKTKLIITATSSSTIVNLVYKIKKC